MITIIRYIGIALWSVICISSSLILMVLLFNRRLPLIMARTMWAPGIIFCAGGRMKVNGLENVDPTKPTFIIANHCSFLDIPCMFRAMPINLHFVAKKSLRKIPFLGWYMIATGMIFVDRANPRAAVQSVNDAAELIKNGKNVIMFPEGTRSATGELAEFKKGAFQLALKSGVQILPVGINGTHKVWNADRFSMKPGDVQLNIGKPINTSSYSRKEVDKLMEDTRSQLLQLL